MGSADILQLSSELDRVKLNLGALIFDKKIKCPVYRLMVFSIFPQVWSDTSCGFGGLAGQAMTTAFSVVLEDETEGIFYIFINGQYAYSAHHSSECFKEDLRKKNLSGKIGCSKYKKELTKDLTQ
jgi:hypothetical protein